MGSGDARWGAEVRKRVRGGGGFGGWRVANGGLGEERLATPGEPPDHSHVNDELLRQQPRCQRKP